MSPTPALPPSFWQVETTLPRLALPALEAALESEAVSISWIEANEAQDLWTFQALFENRPQEAQLKARVALVAAAQGIAEPEVSVTFLEGRDWLAQSKIAFPPLQIGRFFIHGSHFEGKPPAGSWSLCLDAATAFGSGTHESTSGCLLALDGMARKGIRPRHILDMGCGSGILGLAAARAWTRPVLGVDIDPESVRVARYNARKNGLSAFFHAEPGSTPAARLIGQCAPYDVIFANILARPLCQMAHGLSARLAPGGRLILAGLLARQAMMVMGAYRQQGLVLEKRLNIGVWSTLVLHRR